MTIKQIAELMRNTKETQMICLQDNHENVLYIGTLAGLERKYPKSLNGEIVEMYTERYSAFNGVSGLTITI